MGNSKGYKRLRPHLGPKVARDGSMECQRVRQGEATYVLRYVRCGKGCTRCKCGARGFDPWRPGHGPYWYREYQKAGKTFRRYCGKNFESVLERAADLAREREAA